MRNRKEHRHGSDFLLSLSHSYWVPKPLVFLASQKHKSACYAAATAWVPFTFLKAINGQYLYKAVAKIIIQLIVSTRKSLENMVLVSYESKL